MRLPVIDRRRLLAIGAALPFIGACSAAPAEAKNYPKGRTEAEWRKALTKDQFYVLRQAGTERAFTSPLDKEKRKGIPIIGDPDPEMLWRLELFYSAVGLAIERQTGNMVTPSSRLMMRASTLGSGSPIEPVTFRPFNGLTWVAVGASDRP